MKGKHVFQEGKIGKKIAYETIVIIQARNLRAWVRAVVRKEEGDYEINSRHLV